MTQQENQPKYSIAKLSKDHIKNNFSCGIDYLDNYLKKQAGQDIQKNVSVTYALSHQSELEILGFYTLSSTTINPGELPSEFYRKLPKYPLLPGVLLGRLAVSKTHTGRGLGGHLLIDALKRSVSISHIMGITAVIVDAKNPGASEFYRHYGFISFIDDPLRLFLPMNTITKLDL